MTDSGGSSFAATPVAPGGGRRPRLVAGLVVVVVVGSFAVARLTPETLPSLTAETIRPTPTLAHVQPVATALPLQEWFSGPAAPFDNVLVEAGSVRWLRVAGARLTDEALARPGRDLLLRGARGGTVCLCWQPSGTESGDPTALDLVRVDDDLRELSRTTVAVVNGLDSIGRPTGPAQVALEPSLDGRFAYLARAIRSATKWQIGLDVIDLGKAAIVDMVDLISAPQSDRSEVSAVERPTLRIAPDGRHVLVMSTIEQETSFGAPSSARHAWIVGLDGPTLGRVVVANAIANTPREDCSWIAFVAPAIIAKGCRYPTSDLLASFEIRRYDLAGRELGPAVDGPSEPDADEPLIDVVDGVVYAWDPVGHMLLAADLVRGGWRSAGSAPSDRDNPGEVLTVGQRPPPGPPTTWSDGRPATDGPRARALVGSPDGRLLFAIGTGSDPGSSSGIWVFDTQTLQLLERWPALASYESVTLFEDGRWLAAIGRPRETATGGPADWGTSITIHDTTTGRPVLRIGDLRTVGKVTFPWPGPEAATP
ncbi:MAG: hypothetical protein Q7S35_04890 [Candidatus Limnocylindrales bacterium]|nr:hypothetical protein [Candidatus Limnocylindrales bacterium]